MQTDENKAPATVNLTNELAKERNRAAYDRTLMAWIRTAISLIGFGFAIATSYEYVHYETLERTGRFFDRMHTPLWFGISFILLGGLCILGGVLQHRKVMREIQSSTFTFTESKPMAIIVALLLLFIGIFALISLFQRRVMPLYSLVAL